MGAPSQNTVFGKCGLRADIMPECVAARAWERAWPEHDYSHETELGVHWTSLSTRAGHFIKATARQLYFFAKSVRLLSLSRGLFLRANVFLHFLESAF